MVPGFGFQSDQRSSTWWTRQTQIIQHMSHPLSPTANQLCCHSWTGKTAHGYIFMTDRATAEPVDMSQRKTEIHDNKYLLHVKMFFYVDKADSRHWHQAGRIQSYSKGGVITPPTFSVEYSLWKQKIKLMGVFFSFKWKYYRFGTESRLTATDSLFWPSIKPCVGPVLAQTFYILFYILSIIW